MHPTTVGGCESRSRDTAVFGLLRDAKVGLRISVYMRYMPYHTVACNKLIAAKPENREILVGLFSNATKHEVYVVGMMRNKLTKL